MHDQTIAGMKFTPEEKEILKNAKIRIVDFDPTRRCDIERMTQVEKHLYEAVLLIESLGADTRLTDAVVHLAKARESVADFIDEVS